MKAKWRTLWALKTILIKSMALWHWSHCKFSRPNDNFLRLVHLRKFKCATNPLHSENAKRSPSFSRERGIIYLIYLLSWFGRSSVKNFAGVFIKFNLFRERVARRFDNLLHFFLSQAMIKITLLFLSYQLLLRTNFTRKSSSLLLVRGTGVTQHHI